MAKNIYKNIQLHGTSENLLKPGSRAGFGTPNSYEEYEACITAEKFNDFKSLRFYKKCFRENLWIAKRAAGYVLNQPNFHRIKNPGSLFTWKFKQLINN